MSAATDLFITEINESMLRLNPILKKAQMKKIKLKSLSL